MKKYLTMIPAFLLIILARFVPFNWIIGSQGASFSWTTMASPVVAKHCGLSWICLFFISAKAWTAVSLFMFLLHRTPLIFASFAYKSRHWLTSFFVPAVCMMLFICHDNGCGAWVYSLFWLIPMILHFSRNSIVTRALAASFIAHGVGSVVWLYSMDISSALWVSLIPVVIIERFLMAAGMIACDALIVKARSLCGGMVISQKTGVA
jgi:hypothetical protein